MIDEIYDRNYQAGRAELHAGIDSLVSSIGKGLETLHRIQWSAPWSPKPLAPARKIGRA
jgi:hypothetical protein